MVRKIYFNFLKNIYFVPLGNGLGTLHEDWRRQPGEDCPRQPSSISCKVGTNAQSFIRIIAVANFNKYQKCNKDKVCKICTVGQIGKSVQGLKIRRKIR